MLPWSVTEKVQRDVAELRVFYASLGISMETTERALAVCFPNLPSKEVAARAPSRRKTPGARRRPAKR
jgi:hypothetical protein